MSFELTPISSDICIKNMTKLILTLIIYAPIVLAVVAIAIFNPTVLTWPVVGLLVVFGGVVTGVAMRIRDQWLEG